jgi:integrase
VEQVTAVTAALPDRYQILVVLAVGCGLRQGEAFGLGVEDVDFLRGIIHVRRQVKLIHSRQVFAPPKGGKSVTCHCLKWSRWHWRRTCKPFRR